MHAKEISNDFFLSVLQKTDQVIQTKMEKNLSLHKKPKYNRTPHLNYMHAHVVRPKKVNSPLNAKWKVMPGLSVHLQYQYYDFSLQIICYYLNIFSESGTG